jgi:hypothetical protein
MVKRRQIRRNFLDLVGEFANKHPYAVNEFNKNLYKIHLILSHIHRRVPCLLIY